MLKPLLDFSSPFFSAAIVVNPKQGVGERRYPLWFSGSPVVARQGRNLTEVNGFTGSTEDISFESLSYVESVSVELGLAYVPVLSASLTPPFHEAKKLLDSEIIEWATSALEIQFGYTTGVGGISPPFRGLIQAPDISYGGDITINLKAQGASGYFLDTTGLVGVFDSKAGIDHINDFAKKLGVERDADLLDDSTAQLLLAPRAVISATKSYLGAIYEIARACGCWLDLSNNKLRLVSMAAIVLREPVAELRLFDFPAGRLTTSFYPILSASSDTTGVYLSSYSKTAIRRALDKTTKTEFEAEMNPASAPAQTKGQQVGYDRKDYAESSRIEQADDQTDEAASRVNQEAAKAMNALVSADGSGIELEVETLGAPNLLPGQNVRVTGLGKRLDDVYTIFSVSHQLSGGGFSTRLTLKQNSGRLTLAVQNAIPARVFGQPPTLDGKRDEQLDSRLYISAPTRAGA